MKKFLSLIIVSVFATTLALAAEDSVTLSGVHLCCGGCVKGVEKAAAKVEGASVSCDAKAGTVTVKGEKAAVKKAVAAIGKAGYYGESSAKDAAIHNPGAKSQAKVTNLTVQGSHLCCGKCIKAVDKALEGVSGVEGHTASKGAKTYEIRGTFIQADAIKALQDAGINAVVSKK